LVERPPVDALDFDPFSEDYAERTTETNQCLRDAAVSRSEHYDGFWCVARHADVVEAFKHDGKALSARHETLEDGLELRGVLMPPSPTHLGFMEHDPPLHHAFRRLMNPWFSVDAAEARRPRIAALASALLDAHIESGAVEMLDDLIKPLATVTTFELLGLPLEGIERYALPAQVDGYDAQQDLAEPHEAFEAMKAEIVREIDSRRGRADVGEGLIGFMMRQRVDGEPIPEELLVDSMFLMLIAGADTVGGAFSGAVHHLAAHPEDRRRLIEDPTLLGPAFDEFVRYETPTTQNARTALSDLELAGQPIRRGDVVYLNLLAANHDEARFPDPETIVLDRAPNHHVGFGIGLHRCIGAPLARVMWTAMLEQVLDRISDWSICEDSPARAPQRGISNFFLRMPAVFTPGRRERGADDVVRDLARAFPSRSWSAGDDGTDCAVAGTVESSGKKGQP
jgi:cytochrome P450